MTLVHPCFIPGSKERKKEKLLLNSWLCILDPCVKERALNVAGIEWKQLGLLVVERNNNIMCVLLEGKWCLFKKMKIPKRDRVLQLKMTGSLSDPACFSLLSGEVASFFLLPLWSISLISFNRKKNYRALHIHFY